MALTNAGDYNRQVDWLQRSEATDTSSGQRVITYSSAGTFWAKIEESNRGFVNEWGAFRSTTTAKITLRQFPSISALDRFQDGLRSHTYLIDSIAINVETNETICMTHRIEGDNV